MDALSDPVLIDKLLGLMEQLVAEATGIRAELKQLAKDTAKINGGSRT